MSTKTKATRRPEQIIAEQKRQAMKLTEVKKADAGTAVAMPDNRSAAERYIDEIAPANIVGRLVKFSKEGKFVLADSDETIDESVDWLALCDETLVGWIRFHHDEETPPDRVQGLLFDGFVMPARDTLGNLDASEWSVGLSGQPEDPWKHQMCLVLQRVDTKEMATFATTSITGRRAIGNLLRHYKRIERTNPGEVPIVRLKPGGFNHRDERIGWVSTPGFAIVGRAPRDAAARPDTSVAADLNDSIPHL